MKAGQKYVDEMGQYPVITLTLKSAKQRLREDAFMCLREVISEEYLRHEQLVVEKLERQADIEKYQRICEKKADAAEYLTCIEFLSKCLYQTYNKKCIILIDEYDVPLENAYFAGFYEEMVSFIRSVFESALKTNPYLNFAVVTGCLRISRESIFTGLNNLRIYSILNENYGEYFGFTEEEVKAMLRTYGREANMAIIKKWYDGYRFGNAEVYNPWSVLNHMQDIIKNKEAFPVPYWANTSSNSIVRKLIELADDEDSSMKEQLEQLIAGEILEVAIHEDITYDSIYDTQENLWNFLFFTGYLKKVSSRMLEEQQLIALAIPNMEVKYIYKTTIRTWFEKKQKSFDMSALYLAIEEGDTMRMGEEISGFLVKSISFFDYSESYYHGFLTGLLQQNGKYRVLSNRESGLGRADIIMKTQHIRNGRAFVFELKVAERFHDMEKKCEEALRQIEEQQYCMELKQEGYQDISAYGICFYRKECFVLKVMKKNSE